MHLEPLATVRVELAPALGVGATPGGERRVYPIVGGSFTGAAFTGSVLSGGADWQLVLADGTALIDTRYLLRTDDGALVYIRTRGFRHGPPDVLARLAAGDPVDPADYYFRLSLHFETAAPAYAWLGRTVAVASARREPAAVVYDAYTLS
ncbi:DUF3237 domain-containing protein [Dactylosporangium vinaceum]|uniref:UPF0311 protein ACFFTR_53275 n=1 Tax=Dactylosporangium vinaceum TaxID=53362 RepID=A0ABV5MSN7_9ACTN|nr:DUF3237 domain-containing protein [Dactylosporangium vinaceum]UAC00952.1 DUF3237 domain-containing protein [Dactylosporangium vinaceum]